MDGGLGNNQLQAVLNSSVRPLALDNIQTIAATAMTNNVTLDLLNAPDAVTVANIQSSTQLTFSNLNAGATDLVVVAPDAGVDTVFVYASTTGTQSVDLEVDGLSTGSSASVVTIAGVETINVTTVNTASTFTLTADSATSVNIAGNQNLVLAGATVATAIDASNFNGNLTAALTVSGTLTGGNGNDTLTGANNLASTIIGGEGDDSIIAGAATSAHDDSMSGGFGDDTFTFAAGFTDTDSIDGGAGINTLIVTAANAEAITTESTTIDNIEILSLSSAGTDTATLQVNLIDSSIAQVNLDSGAGATYTVNLNAGTSILTLGDATGSTLLTVNDTGSALTDSVTIQNTNTVTGGSAVDVFAGALTVAGFESISIDTGSSATVEQAITTLTVNTDATATAPTLTFLGANGIDISSSIATSSTGVLSIDASGMTAQAAGTTTFDVAAISMGTGGTISIAGSEGEDLIGASGAVLANLATTVIAGAGVDAVYTGSAADSVDGGSGNDTLNTGTGNDTARGGHGDDTITVSTGAVSVDGGSGNDSILMGSTLGETDTIDGGVGDDTLTVTAAVSSPAIGARVSNVEYLNVSLASALTQDLSMFTNTTLTKLTSNTTSADITVSNAGSTFNNLTLTGAAPGTVAFSRTTAADAAATSLTVSFERGNSQSVTALNVNDEATLTINTTASSAATITDLGAAELTALTISGAAGVTISNAIGGTTSISTITNSLTGSAALSLSAASNTSAITFTAGTSVGTSTITTGSGADLITAGAGALSVDGGSGADTITGGTGADTIVGGQGNDSLTGGAGNDTITGGVGADYVDGGSGVDTFSAAGMNGVTDGGLVTTSGAVVNLSATTLIAANITTTTNLYTANNGAGNINILSGQAAYLGSTGNDLSTIVDTLVNIDNVIGSNGTDYIVTSNSATTVDGGSGADTINGGTGNDSITGSVGADNLTGGGGVDTFNYALSGDTAANVSTSVANPGVVTVTSMDIITDAAAGDLIKIAAPATAWSAVNDRESAVDASGGAAALGETADITFQTVIYSAATGATTAAKADSNALLLTWDTNGAAAGTTYNTILIVGVTDFTSVNLTTGLITL